jgi:hypothetical protein
VGGTISGSGVAAVARCAGCPVLGDPFEEIAAALLWALWGVLGVFPDGDDCRTEAPVMAPETIAVVSVTPLSANHWLASEFCAEVVLI